MSVAPTDCSLATSPTARPSRRCSVCLSFPLQPLGLAAATVAHVAVIQLVTGLTELRRRPASADGTKWRGQGTGTDSAASLNYSMQNYANDVVAALKVGAPLRKPQDRSSLPGLTDPGAAGRHTTPTAAAGTRIQQGWGVLQN